jgi:lon-related putative ATP-dependent protease
VPEVSFNDLRPVCDPGVYNFTHTGELSPYLGLIGQDRALDAIKFGLSIESKGFNICVSGEPGTGRGTAIADYLEDFAKTRAVPDDWCYVYNFAEPYRPRALRLPPSKGGQLASQMAAMLHDARERVPRTFESDDFATRRDQIMGSVQRHRDQTFNQLADQTRAAGFLLQGNAGGFFLVPLAPSGQAMDDQSFAALSPEERKSILEKRDQMMDQLRQAMKQEAGLEQEALQRLADLEQTVAKMVVSSLLDRLVDSYRDFPAVTQYLSEVREDMIANIGQFQRQAADQPPVPGPLGVSPTQSPRELGLRKYTVNVVVDNGPDEHAPVVYETNPTPGHLLGRIEKEAVFGALLTDFTMIRPGSLHQANGGFLVLTFDDLLANPVSYLELKRTLRTGQVTIEEMGDRLGFVETKTVRPEPIPWKGKIVGIAREEVYRVLFAGDPEFRELFKVKADFDQHIDRTPEHEQAYAGLIAAITQKEGLLPLDVNAVARVVEEGTRLAEDRYKLSIRFGDLMDVVREAEFWARSEGKSLVGLDHVRRAVHNRVYRVNLIEEHIRESIKRGILLVDTEGEDVGQVNGLSVIDLGDASFGQPSRITASIGVGREGLLDLQRESNLAGPIFSKAVLTLQGFLVDRYAESRPLALHARLAFEQSYGLIEGDSATCAETCALLSRLADAPVKQSFAITGSMNQRGEVQAIGGVNYKIEGFYDVCRERGLTGDQAVIIPASNIQHLVLREDVVEAVKEGKFKVYSISRIDEAMELLTGIEAGEKDAAGNYPLASLNGRVMEKLRRLSERLRESQPFPEQSPVQYFSEGGAAAGMAP